MTGVYNPWLVTLSIVIAVMASYTALDLARRVTTAKGSVAIAWLLGGAFAMGTGIWSMHFVGMLAFSLPIAMAYQVTTTLLSMLIAVVVSAFALYVISRRELTLQHFVAGGVLMGLGISAMHYTGMAAMDMLPSISYDTIRVSASVAIAIIASLVALLIAMKLPKYDERIARPAQAVSAVVMGVAIAGMHYTAMSAARFAPSTICVSGTSVNNAWLAAVIALVAFTILSSTLLLSMFDSRYKRKTGGLRASLNEKQDSLDQAHQQLRHLALHDGLTNLPNRTFLEERLGEVIKRANAGEGFCALMFLDLDRFKVINDSLGHQAGDEVLQEAARRIRSRVRHDDTVSRIGGDEFVVLIFKIDRPDDAAVVAQKLLEAFDAPIRVRGAEVITSMSIGISVAPEDGITVGDLMAHADVAMYHAKKQGRNNYQFYRQELNEFAGKRLALENGLRRAIVEQQFELWYQPKINMSSGKVVGLEALVRWRHPDHGLVLPMEFIPLAEETGLITPLGTWVIRAACRQNRIWRDAGLPKFRIAVNVSAAQFRQPSFPRIIMDALKESQLEPEALELEVTESVVMSNPEEAVLMLEKIRQMGIHISIDDFGTGYSSLSYLKKFPIDTLKVDRSFIRDVVGNSDDAAIVKAIVALAQSLKLNIVAEGVEDAAQLSFLNTLGCDEYQGYYFSRPVPPADIAVLPNERVSDTAASPT